jgi:transcriptional regulator with GAF, ATPase, and Fis domain
LSNNKLAFGNSRKSFISGSELLPPFTVNMSAGPTFFDEIESAAYRASLERTNGNIAGAARLLNISRAKLEYRLRRLGIIL